MGQVGRGNPVTAKKYLEEGHAQLKSGLKNKREKKAKDRNMFQAITCHYSYVSQGLGCGSVFSTLPVSIAPDLV